MLLVQLRVHLRRLLSASVLSIAVMMLWIYSEKTCNLTTQTSMPTPVRHVRMLSTVSPNCGSGEIVGRGQFVRVNGTNTLLVSAFQEHRTKAREVRVVAISLRSESATYLCLLCCEDQLHISEGTNVVLPTHYYFAYGASHLMCPLPDACGSPSHVSVVSTEVDTPRVGVFLKVENQQPREEDFPLNFTVCISHMFEYNNVLQLVQSLEMLRMLGAGRVVIYRSSGSNATLRVLDYYTQRGFVEVIPWPITTFLKASRSWLPHLSSGDIHYFGQLPALNDCLYRSMYRTHYLALHDLDELILPQAVSSWAELFLLLEKNYSDQCFSFENNVFPTNVVLAPPKWEELHPFSRWHPGTQVAPGVNILAHLYQEPQSEELRLIKRKIIFNPRGVFVPNVHDVAEAWFGCVEVDRNLARMYHTRSPLQPELTPDKLVYDSRLLDYSPRLIPAVTSVLQESGLLVGNR